MHKRLEIMSDTKTAQELVNAYTEKVTELVTLVIESCDASETRHQVYFKLRESVFWFAESVANAKSDEPKQ